MRAWPPQRAATASRPAGGTIGRFDALVVGAGPAGSATAYRLAQAGASVLLVDRARFPRDKPCGGGLTARARREASVSLEPVVEERTSRVELRLGYRDRTRFERQTAAPLVLMTSAAGSTPTWPSRQPPPRRSSAMGPG